MRIFLGTDHAGFGLKEKLKIFLQELGYEMEDMGNFVYDDHDDYPDFVRQVAGAVAKNPDNDRGIVLGGSGQGEAMVCNKVKGIRAAVFYGSPGKTLGVDGETPSVEEGEQIIRLSREHNNANILALGARFLSEEEAKKTVKLWLETDFSNEERHKRRIAKLDQ